MVHNIVKKIEKSIGRDMRTAGRGAIMYDGWSKCGMHYIGLFACYMKKVKVSEKKELKYEYVPKVTLISVAPMLRAWDEETDDAQERELACQFNAKLHVDHFKRIFEHYFSLDLQDWAVCCIADNTSTNHKVARDLELPHIGCSNHLLNLDVKDWVKHDFQLNETVESLNTVMKQARSLRY